MTEQDTVQAPTANGSGGLGSLKLAQLKDLASQLGITGTSRMRKAQLVEVIADHQRGGSPVANDKPAAEAVDTAQDKADKAPEQAQQNQQQPAKQPARQDTSDKVDKAQRTPDATDDTQQTEDDQPKQRGQQSRGRRGSRGGQQRDEQQTREDKTADGQAEAQSETADKTQNSSKESDDNNGQDRQRGRTRNQQRRDQNRQRRDQQDDQDEQDDQHSDDSSTDEQSDSRPRRDDDQRNQRRQRQRDRNRSRDRRREQEDDDDQDQEVSEDETLIPISGILDVLDNYAFVRTSGYLPGPNDVYVSMAMVKRFGLRKGDAIRGRVRAPQADDDKQQNQQGGRGGGRGGRGGRNRRGGGGSGGGTNRQKFNALVKIDSLNGQEATENPKRVEFNKLTPLYPQERLRLESNNNPKDMGPRLVDLVAPIGKGQRGLIVSPPKAGKTMMLQSIANAITTNNPEVKLMMVLVDERPEEVTDMQRSVRGEVIASTFDRPAEDHTTVAELSIERAKRMVELGHDVVVLLDSMTRLGRAYNLATPASGRILSGGVDSAALYPPKKFFGAARNIEGGGSLTILATALVETGSRMDEVIFEEFKGTGNMELRLSRELSERRIFPAIDINASGTRREENLLTKEEIGIMWRLRRVLSGLETQQALELLTSKLKETETNAEFLMLVSKTTLRGQSDS